MPLWPRLAKLSRTPLMELTALSGHRSWIQEATSRREAMGRAGKKGRKEREKRGKEKEGKGWERTKAKG